MTKFKVGSKVRFQHSSNPFNGTCGTVKSISDNKHRPIPQGDGPNGPLPPKYHPLYTCEYVEAGKTKTFDADEEQLVAA